MTAADQQPDTGPSTAPQLATPAEALRQAVHRLTNARVAAEWREPVEACTQLLSRWADELDAAPAAPRTYQLPAEPPPEVTELWDHEGARWRRVEPQPPYGADWVPWEVLNDEPTVSVEAVDWAELVYSAGPLSTVPPAGTRRPLRPELAHARVQYWVCPIPGHSDSRTGRDGQPVVTVEWRDDVAYCLVVGCEHNSAETVPPAGTEAQ